MILFGCSLLHFKKEENLFNTPRAWPKPEYNFKQNAINKKQVQLGRILFYDPILSRDSSISCASCHSQYNAFAHADHSLSHGINDQIGTRNAPTLQNLAWNKFFMWDGAIHNLDVQALAPITHPKEMNESLENVIAKLNRSNFYQKLFWNTFHDSVVTSAKTVKAISQFLLTLISSNSKYDRVKWGEEDFSEQEKNGYKLFKKNCSSCHVEPLFTSGKFENNGLSLNPELNDYGRVNVSQEPSDSFKFKVPTLRNIEYSFPYMHDGRYTKLSEAIRHYHANKIFERINKKTIQLTSNEISDITAFLLTLSDKTFIFDKKHSYPKDLLLNEGN